MAILKISLTARSSTSAFSTAETIEVIQAESSGSYRGDRSYLGEGEFWGFKTKRIQ